ncbi:hypothetical protein, partial [Pseudomonas sp. ICBG1301]|uniref:hypothetical protein n=1 Tax=Pseudomonas sp. ICBG1301 TaxID=2795987 RepID=UPI001963A651
MFEIKPIGIICILKRGECRAGNEKKTSKKRDKYRRAQRSKPMREGSLIPVRQEYPPQPGLVVSGLAPVQTGDIVYISNRGHGLQANTHDQEVTDHALEPRV